MSNKALHRSESSATRTPRHVTHAPCAAPIIANRATQTTVCRRTAREEPTSATQWPRRSSIPARARSAQRPSSVQPSIPATTKKKKKQHQRSNHAALAVSTQKIQRRWMAYLERDDANQDAKDEEDERDDEPDDAPNFARNSVVSTARRSEKAVTSAP
jgi:hypothetical protein